MGTQSTARPADASGTFDLGGDLTINRLGYGAMQLTGPGVWGDPRDPDEALRVLRRAVELGVNFIDTADAYGPFVNEQLIRRALHPYADDLVIATKGGQTRQGPGPSNWTPVGRPEYLRQQTELSLRHLGVERIDLYQLHRVDPKVPLAEQIGELARLQQEGKIRHIGLSEVTVEQLKEARTYAEIASVQNLYNLANRSAEDVLEYAEAENIAFIPWFPIATGELARAGGQLDAASRQHGATPSQLALAWLLRRSPVMLPIPGTSSTAHLEENTAAASVRLSDEEFEALAAAVRPGDRLSWLVPPSHRSYPGGSGAANTAEQSLTGTRPATADMGRPGRPNDGSSKPASAFLPHMAGRQMRAGGVSI